GELAERPFAVLSAVAFPVDGDGVAPRREPALEARSRGIDAATRKPARPRGTARLVEDALRRSLPFDAEVAQDGGPESLGGRDRAVVQTRVSFGARWHPRSAQEPPQARARGARGVGTPDPIARHRRASIAPRRRGVHRGKGLSTNQDLCFISLH